MGRGWQCLFSYLIAWDCDSNFATKQEGTLLVVLSQEATLVCAVQGRPWEILVMETKTPGGIGLIKAFSLEKQRVNLPLPRSGVPSSH